MSEISEEIINPGHGNSPAAWTAVIIVLAAFVIGTITFVAGQPVGVLIAAIVAAVGVIVGVVLSKMGLGAHSPRYAHKSH
ncbi:DUF6704 family protein [Pseudoclavibacter sp. 13-3]|uniref:DUF6704 family protein n=1 Tax=Pseudoclavibacter sp. 13-3 TaxID=2901228 RepID=UPI001E59E8C5|nr:DUF6704 family protein [Pseudoclavibacter sp. 13-3]MCD7101981.1 hypothetical protein [Pseudoclavibacter sp. 13-3]